jgi:inner membrane protein
VASLLTHLGVGLVAGRVAFPSGPHRLVWLAAFLSAAPDLDVVTFAFGTPYAHALGHRGLSHSLVVAAAAGLLAALAVRARPPWRTGLVLAAVTASHGVLDALTNGGLGVALLAPFDDARYFFPWRPLEVSPLGARAFLSRRGLEVLTSEILWVWLPVGALALLALLARRRRPEIE